MTVSLQEDSIQVADNIRSLKPYHPGRPIEEVQREYGLTNIIKLASNENSLGPSPLAIQAIKDACESIGLYPDGACYELKQALSLYYNVDPATIAISNGSDELIQYLGLAFLQSGDEVIQADPTFVRYEAAATLGKAKLISIPCRNFTHDLEAMADAFTDRTRLVFVTNPNNPTGTMNTRHELERMISRLPSRAILVLDEAYREYVENSDYPDSLAFIEAGANVISLRTFSKVYALAGLRIGYAFARPQIIDYLNQVREPFNVNMIAQVAAVASLRDREQVERSRSMNRAGKAILYSGFEAMNLEYVPTSANFILVNVGKPGNVVAKEMERRGVIIRPGTNLGLPSFIRVTIGTEPECQRFLKVLKEALD